MIGRTSNPKAVAFERRVQAMQKTGNPFRGYLHRGGWALYRTDAYLNTCRIRIPSNKIGVGYTDCEPGTITLKLHEKQLDRIIDKLRKKGQLLCTVECAGEDSPVHWKWEDE